ncbi:MAG: ferric reductase-like transmembrane domain-containing protein [Acidobacteriota bacterium]
MQKRELGWILGYISVVAAPLVTGGMWPGAAGGRSWGLQFGVACGFVGLAMMALEFVLIARIGVVARLFGMDGLMEFHKQMGMVASVFVGLHVAMLLGEGLPLSWVLPWSEDSSAGMRAGVGSVVAMLLLVGLSVARKKVGLGYEWWQWSHNVLAKLGLAGGGLHVWWTGGFSSEAGPRVLLGVYVGVLLGVIVYFEVWRPLRLWNKPWEVVENRAESSDTRTLRLRPVGHEGMRFAAGQFAWLNTGATPFSKDSHPISMASAPGREVEFTIKNLGDWSGEVAPKLGVGRRLWVDGPYGVFTPEGRPAPGYVLLGGGVGVTPLVSMCEAFAARGDARPVYLFYGAESEEKLRFRARLEKLRERSKLEVIFVLERPGADWPGARGWINEEILRKHLPENYRKLDYFVCGPAAMMDAMEELLQRIGVAAGRIHTERFEMV